MRSKFWAMVLLCLVATSLMSEDAIKADPKHYKLAFENENVQVVYIHYGAHEKSEILHSHPKGVVVNVSDSHLKITDEKGKTQEIFGKPGEARWFPAFEHSVENLSNKAYDGVYVGVKK